MKAKYKHLLKNVMPYVLLILITVTFTLPLFKNQYNTGAGDWDFFCFQNEVPRITILKYLQFPLWNPYASGGRPLLADPQAGFISPTFLTTLIFGCVMGLKIKAFIMILVGLIGVYLLSKYYKLSPIAGIISASIFGLSSYISLHVAEGHVVFLPFLLFPLIFLFYLKSIDNWRYLFLSSALIALIIFDGGIAIPLLITILFLSVYALFYSFQKKSLTPLVLLICTFLVAFGISAIQSIPTMDYLAEHPRTTSLGEKTPLYGLYYVFLYPNQQLWQNLFPGQAWNWHENGAYTGVLPIILFLLGLILFFTRQYPLIITGLFIFAISLGDLNPYMPWVYLHKLPFFNSVHVPMRFIILFVFSLALIAGFAFDYVWRKVKEHPTRFFLLLIGLLCIIDLLVVNSKPFTQPFVNTPPKIDWNNEFQQIWDSNTGRSGAYSSMYYNLLANHGTLNAYNPIYHQASPKSINDEAYKGEVYLEDGGNAYYKYWSPNKLIVGVNSTNTTRVIINQNYDKGWHVKGGKAENFNGLLSAQVPGGVSEITLYYLPTSFVIGAVISLLMVVGIILVMWKKPKIKFSKRIKQLYCKFSSYLR